MSLKIRQARDGRYWITFERDGERGIYRTPFASVQDAQHEVVRLLDDPR